MTRAAALLCALAASSRADTVYLKNGNTMDGVVTSQTAASIELDIGYGTVTLSKTDVKRVVRSGAPAAAAGRRVRDGRFESGRAVPRGAEALAALYQETLARREKALDARVQAKTLLDERRDILERQPGLKRAFREATERLSGLDARINPSEYNEAVAELNRDSTQLQSGQLRVEEIEQQVAAVDGESHRYLAAYRELERGLRGPGANQLKAGGAGKDYCAWLEGRLRALARDFRSDSVTAENPRGSGLIVKAVLNGRVTGRFLVDTGASTTLLYQGIADALSLGPDARVGRTRARVADGREVEAEVVRLDSIQVGKSRVDGTLATVVPAAGRDFDGLLGMSFLSRFAVRVDAANGRLVLEDMR